MKQAMKRLLALTMALLLALPTFALADDEVTAPVEDWVEEQIVEIGGDPEPEASQADAPVNEVSQEPEPEASQADAPVNEVSQEPEPEASQADVPVADQADAPTADQADAPAADQADAPVVENADAPTAEQADAPVDEQADAPVVENADEPAPEQTDADAVEEGAELPTEADGEPDAEAADEARGYAVVRFNATPENASIEVYPAGSDEVVSPMEDGAWWLEPGEYEYSAWGEECLALERAAFTVAEGDQELEIAFALESAPVAFEQTRTVDGVAVTVAAEAGAFPAGATLYVAKVPVAQQREADAAVEDAREADQNVAVSYTFDIQVQDADGNELQPAEGYAVSVSFALAEVADENLTTSVYHVTEDADGALTADKLEEVEVDAAEETVTAQTDGFSIYTVEFTYESLQYVLQGGTSAPLSDIVRAVGLTGEVEGATVSNDALFSVSDETGEWMLASHRPFTSEEWLKVVVGGVEYEIAVTDSGAVEVSYTGGTATAYIIDVNTEELTGEWHYVDGNVTLAERLNIQGNVNLILCDNATLTAPKGIRLAKGNSLTIYGQAGGSGTLNATANAYDFGYAGIGGDEQESGGAFTLYGGTVNATGSENGAGIGGGDSGCGGVVTVYGGTLNATGGEGGAGIGGGLGGSQGGNISIYGGTVTATGGAYAAGIGGGQNFSDEFGNEEFGGNGGNVYVYGGNVRATGGIRAAGIGGGQFGNGGMLSVAGSCMVTATAGEKSSRDANGVPAIGRGELSTEREDDHKQTEGSVVLSDGATVKAGDAAPGEEYTGSSRAAACRKPYACITSTQSLSYAIDAQVNQVHEDRVTDTIEAQNTTGDPINQAKGGDTFKVVLTLGEDSEFDSITATYTSGGQQKTLATGEPTITGNTRTYTLTMPSDVDKDTAVKIEAVVRAKEYNVYVTSVTPNNTYGSVTLLRDDQDMGTYSTAMQGERVYIRAVADEVNHPDWFLQSLTVTSATNPNKVYAKLENDVKTNIAMGADEDTWFFIMPDEAVVITANFQEGCHYIALDGNRKVRRYFNKVTSTEQNLYALDGNGAAAGWWIVKGDVTITNRLNITSDVNLILCDGAKLTANDGIFVAKRCNARLTIWAQSSGSGKIYAKVSDSHWAGIGANKNDDAGAITINGGTIEAHGGSSAAGIGGGQYCHCDSITISVPKGKADSFTTVKAYGGKYGAGIGAGEDVSNQLVVIKGGYVEAHGGDYGAGIGGGEGGGNEKTIINGGEVYAYGGKNAAGIGGGEVQRGGGYGGTVEIHGGYVYAKGDDEAAGIGGGGDGGGGANVTITGGKVRAISGSDVPTCIGGGDKCGNDGALSIADHMKVTGDRIATTSEREGACRWWSDVTIEACTHDGRKPVPVDFTNHRLDSCQYCKLGGALKPHVWGVKTNNMYITDGQCTECGLVRYRSIAINNAAHIEAQLYAGKQALNTKRDGAEETQTIWSGIYLDRHDRAITVKVRPVDGYLLTGAYEAFYMVSGSRVNINLGGPSEEDGWRVYTFTMPENGEVNLTFTAQPVRTNIYVNITNPEGVDKAGSVQLRNENGYYLAPEYNVANNLYVISGKQKITATVRVKSGYVMDSFTVTDANGAAYAFTKTALNTYQFDVDGSGLNINVTFREGKRGRVYHVLQQIDANGNLYWPDNPGDPLSKTIAGTYTIPNYPANEVVPRDETGWEYIIRGYREKTTYTKDDSEISPVASSEDFSYTGTQVEFQSNNEALYVYYKLAEQRLILTKADGGTEEKKVPFGMPVKKYLEKNDITPQNYGYGDGYVWAWRNEKGKLVRLTDSKTMPLEKNGQPALVLKGDYASGKAIVCLDLGGYDVNVNYYDEGYSLWPSAFSRTDYNQNYGSVWMVETQARAFEVDLGAPLPANALAAMSGARMAGYKIKGWYGYGDTLWDEDRPVTEDDCATVNVNGVSTYAIRLKAKWVLRDAIIEYDPTGDAWIGGVPEPTLVSANSTATLADEPQTKPGWYIKWKDNAGNMYDYSSSYYYHDKLLSTFAVLADTADPDARNVIPMKAVYEPMTGKPYYIYFYSAEGEEYQEIKPNVDADKIDKPFTVIVDGNLTKVFNQNTNKDLEGVKNHPLTNPTREGYTFLGWSETPNGAAKTRLDLKAVWGSKRPYPAYLYARWSVNRHTLTLDVNGGFWPEGTFVQTGYNYGEAIDWDSLVPVKDHYDFKGWTLKKSDGTVVEERPATMPDFDLTAKAQWEQHQYTMTFMNEGQVYKEYTMPYGTALDKPADPPARAGYTFSGWLPELPEGPLTMPEYDAVYTARWLRTTDTPDAPAAQAVSRTALEIVNPVKGQMYRIYRDGDAGTPWREADGRSMVFDSLTPGKTYNVVTYMPGEPGVTTDSPVSAATRVTLPGAVAVRLDLGGYDSVADYEEELRGEYWLDWPQRSYEDSTAYFYAEDKTIPRSFMVDEGAALDADVVELMNKAVCDGHRWTGWQARNGRDWDANTFTASAAFFDAGNGGQRVATAVSDEGLTYTYHFITLEAQWVLLPARVEFNLMGGRWPENQTPEEIIIQPGGTATLPAAIPIAYEWDGKLWRFKGWEVEEKYIMRQPGASLTYSNLKDYFYGGRGISSGIEEDERDNQNIIYLAAIYEMLPAVDVTVQFVTNTGETIPDFSTKIPEGEATATVTVSDVDWEDDYQFTVSDGTKTEKYDGNKRNKTGYTFTGWYKDEACQMPVTGPIVFERGEGKPTTVTLYAGHEATQFTIIFDSNGGTPVQEITQAYDTTVTKPANPVKAHYDFAGWKIVPGYGAGIPKDGNYVDWTRFTTMPAMDLMLEADWTPIEYTITLTTNANEGGWTENGETVRTKEITGTYGAPVTPPANPEWEGHVFNGWKKKEGNTVEGDLVPLPATMPDTNPTYVAQWLEKPVKPDAPVAEAVNRNSLKVNVKPGQEYSIDGGTSWRSTTNTDLVFDGLIPGAAYDVITRVAAVDGASVASEASDATRVILPQAVVIRLDVGAYDANANAQDADIWGNYWSAGDRQKYGTALPAYMSEEQVRSFMIDENATLTQAVLTAMSGTVRDGYLRGEWKTKDGTVWAQATTAEKALYDRSTPVGSGANAYYVITLTAQWNLRPATFGYDPNNGNQGWASGSTAPEDQTLAVNGTVNITDAKPKAPMGMEFSCWRDATGNVAYVNGTAGEGESNTYTYSDLSAVTEFGAKNTDDNNTITLRAEYTPKPEANGHLIFDSQGGTAVDAVDAQIGEGQEMLTVNVSVDLTTTNNNTTVSRGNSALGTVANPTREGYTFKGWKKTENATKAEGSSFTVQFTRDGSNNAIDQVLYAVWELNSYDLTFKELNTQSGTCTVSVPYGTALPKTSLPGWPKDEEIRRDHFNFRGWEGLPETMPANNLEVTAVYEAIKYNIFFDSNGGSTVSTITATFGADIGWPRNPTLAGYEFKCWQDSDGIIIDADNRPTTMPDTNPTYQAQWLVIPPQPGAPEVTATTRNSLTVKVVPGQEYKLDRINGDSTVTVQDWHVPTPLDDDGNYTYTNLIPGATYKVYTYKPAVGSYTDSPISTPTVVTLPNEVHVVFDTSAGESVAWKELPIILDEGQSLLTTSTDDAPGAWSAMLAATRPGYRLTDWHKKSDEDAKWNETRTISLDECDKENGAWITTPVVEENVVKYSYYTLTLKAGWALRSARVQYDLNGGKWPMGQNPTEPVIQPNGTATITSVEPVYEASGKVWVFDSWRFNANKAYDPEATLTYSDLSDVSEPASNGDNIIRLTATYKLAAEMEGKLTFDPNGGVGENAEVEVTIPEGEPKQEVGLQIDGRWTKITDSDSVVNPTREGYTLLGWSLNPRAADHDAVDTVQLTRTAHEKTLYAVWQKNVHTLTVNGLGPDADVTDWIEVEYGERLSDKFIREKLNYSLERDYYTLDGWQGLPKTMPDEDVTATALWKAIVYSVTLKYNDGFTPNYTVSAVHDAKSPVVYPDEPTRKHYVFMGWKRGGSDEVIAHADLPDNLPGANKLLVKQTYVAQWDRARYTLSFDTAGGSAVEPITDVYGATVTPPADPTRAHYKFVRWEPAVPASMPDSDTTVRAVWHPLSYSVVFMDGDAEYGRIVDVFGAKLTPPADPVKEGMAFKGWSDRASGTSAVRLPETMPDDNPVYYAIWGPPKDDGPVAQKPVLVSRTATTLTIETRPGEEYSIDGGRTWQTGDTFTGLTPATTYSIVARIAETDTTYAGPASEPLIATTDKLPQGPVEGLTSDPSSSMTAKDGKIHGVGPGMEYSPDGGRTWIPVTGETVDKLVPGEYLVRYAEDAAHHAGPASAVTVNGTEADMNAMLIATMRSVGDDALNATWTGVAGVDGYDVYFVNCGNYDYQLCGTVPADAPRSFDFKGLETKHCYKVIVKAWTGPADSKQYVAESPVAHCYTTGGAGKLVNPASLTLKKADMTIRLGKTAKIRAGVKGVRKGTVLAHDHKLRYISNDPAVATVNRSGKVRAVGSGSCVIYVLTSNGIWASVTVTVDDSPAKVKLTGAKKTMRVGETQALGGCVKLTHPDARTTLAWVSSNPAVATVDENGNVKALSKGKVTITVVTHNGKKAKLKIKVK